MAQPAEEKIPEIDHGVARRLFKEYVTAKKAAGQATKGLSYGKMLKKLSMEANRLKEKLGQDVEVRFEVKTIDGKVRLRALRDKGSAPAKAKAKPAPPKVPSAKPPPIPGGKPGGKKAAPVAPPVLAPPEVEETGESGEELAGAEISHDDLDQLEVTDDSLGPETLGADDSMAATLAALRAEEEEPLPPTAAGITESQRLSFATLGDIAKRMDQLADKREAPKKEAKAEADAAVLEGESSGAADIRAVAASIKKKAAPQPEPELGAPSGEVEGDSVPISLGEDDEEDDAPVTAGFGDQAAVAVVTQAHSALTGAPILDDEEEETSSFSPAAAGATEEKRGGFPVGLMLLLIIAVAGGVGYVMYGDQLLGQFQNVAQQKGAPATKQAGLDPSPGPEDEPDATANAPEDEDGDEDGDEPDPEEGTGDDGALAMAEDETGGDEEVDRGSGSKKKDRDKKKKKGPRPASGDGENTDGGEDADGGEPPDDGGELPPDPPPEEKKDEGSEVDCLLNPDAPGCKKEKKVVEEDKGPELPQKLTQNQLRDGFQKVKGNAKLCGKQHGAETGTKVQVKVSIEGKTGGITKATPQGSHAATALGKCVAEALQRASFPEFASPAMGVTWSIKM